MSLEKRTPIISRDYQKRADICRVFVSEISGGEISGSVFQYELWLNNQEQTDQRFTSGDRYAVRRRFINKLLDLQEDGWKKQKAATYEPSSVSFFEPGEL